MTMQADWNQITRDAEALAHYAFNIGDRVTTRSEGEGRITALRGDYADVRLSRPERWEIPNTTVPLSEMKPELTRAEAMRAALRSGSEIEPRLTCSYLVKGWLDKGAFSALYGEPNVGKSFLALDMALHVAAGVEWYGSRIEGGRVVYVASEGGGGFGNRYKVWERQHPQHRDKVRDNFHALTVPLDLCGSDDAAVLVEALADLKPSLIVIDTLARSMGAGDENNAADMGALVRNVDMIREKTGAHVLLVHHSGKDTTRGARGHSSLKGAVDTEIEVTRSGDVIQATTTKQRDMTCGKVFAYRLNGVLLGHDEDGDAVTSCTVEPCEPVAKQPRLSGQAKVAIQALEDATAQKGERKTGEGWPPVRVIPLAVWREFCDLHGLADGGDEAKRKAFKRHREALHEKGLIRVYDGHVWKVPSGGTKPNAPVVLPVPAEKEPVGHAGPSTVRPEKPAETAGSPIGGTSGTRWDNSQNVPRQTGWDNRDNTLMGCPVVPPVPASEADPFQGERQLVPADSWADFEALNDATNPEAWQ